MAIAAICLASLFFLKNSASEISFAHSREILRRSSAAIPAPAQGAQISPQNPDATKPYVSANAVSLAPLASAAKSKAVPTGKPSLHNSSPRGEGANQPEDVAADEETSANSGVDNAENQLDATPANSSATGANSGTNDSASKTSASPKSSAPPANSSAGSATTSAVRPVPPASAIAKEPARNPVSSNNVLTRTPVPFPARPNGTSITPSPARNVNSPIIQMDTPARQVMEIHLQRGSHASFFNLPGERILESPLATMHIQRSVRMPAAHSVWPFNRSKKVVIGGLISRVDPQVAQAQIGSDDFIRVTATVDENGRVESVKPTRGRASLVPAVLKAVQEWRYQPTLIDGKPVETKCDVLIEFHASSRYSARQ
jgi:Gram-negative bacterial TonB protein C-terminal